MINYVFPTYKLIVWLIIVITITGCNATSGTAQVNQMETNIENQISLKSSTPIPSPRDVYSTLRPSYTITLFPTNTISPKVTPTKTHLPTLKPTVSPTEAAGYVLELLETNAGCEIPCWWGITPASTSWQEAKNILSRTNAKISLIDRDEVKKAEAIISIPQEFSRDNSGEMGIIMVLQDNVVSTINVNGFKLAAYQISTILLTYGKPSEVWLSTTSEYPGDRLPFVMVLFYPERGMMFTYGSYGKKLGDAIQGCFDGDPGIRLWDKTEILTFQEVAEKFKWDITGSYHKKIEEVTPYDVNSFFVKYKESSVPPCIETPAEYWPSQFSP